MLINHLRFRTTLITKVLKTFVALIIAIFIFGYNALYPSTEKVISFKINNFVYLSYYFLHTSVPNYFAQFLTQNNLIEKLKYKNQRLQHKLSVISGLKIQNIQLLHRNTELAHKLSLITNSPYKLGRFITTNIYSKSYNIQYKILNLNIGTNKGLTKNAPVVSEEMLIGRISKLSKNYASIMLITDPLSKISVYTTQSHNSAIMQGNDNTNPSLTTYGVKHNFIQGEPVVTSGLSRLFPRNIPIGIIHKTLNGTLEVLLYADIYKVNYVHILIK